MFAPLAAAALSLAAIGHGIADRQSEAHRFHDAAYALAMTTGLIGTAFHLYNIGKRITGRLRG